MSTLPCRLSVQRLAALILWVSVANFAQASGRLFPDVLVIMVDDLRPALGCYGDPIARTPHMDRLAARGMLFELAYCNQAVCAPSRYHLMLGAHSTTTGLYGLSDTLRTLIPNAVTLPQHFARYGGYWTESVGKVFHIGHGNPGDPGSFSCPPHSDKVIEYVAWKPPPGFPMSREEALFSNSMLGRIASLPRGPAVECEDVPDDAYADGRMATEVLRRLDVAQRRRAHERRPTLLFAGFVRPHLPFAVPRRYWDLYDPAKLPMPDTLELPRGAPPVAGKTGGEIAAYDPVPQNGRPDPQLTRRLIHGYYAAVSYVDAQIGRVLDALERSGAFAHTIVVLWGDNGFHLGDHGLWTKHTNYESATRIPLIIVAPGVTPPGTRTRQPASTVDLFATLCDLVGLPAPRGPQPNDGMSLMPVLRDPTARVRDHVFHVYPRQKWLGRAIRTERYRLVEWRHWEDRSAPPQLELYDLDHDPRETVNLADTATGIVAQLSRRLAAYPDPVRPGAHGEELLRTWALRSPPLPPPEEIEAALRAHDRAIRIHGAWIRDPYIVVGPDRHYYLTGTTAEPGDPRELSEPHNRGLGSESIVGWQVRVWRSPDLIRWEYLGQPFTLTDGVWYVHRRADFERTPKEQWRLWAPELHWIGDRWAIVHTSPAPVPGANLALSPRGELRGPWTNPMGEAIGRRHDPSLFRDEDGTWWLVWGATKIAPLEHDWSGFRSAPIDIGPAGEPRTLGHEGCTIRKIFGRYVLFGTGWSTASMRRGSYNLYACTSTNIAGPYSERRFVGRFLGHGTPFQDLDGRWWCTAFYNADVPPLPREGIETNDLRDRAATINLPGTTLVPLEVIQSPDGDVWVRAKDPAYRTPGPDEAYPPRLGPDATGTSRPS